MANNFDTSSTGVNLELACFYDTDRSQIDFEDNFIYKDIPHKDLLIFTDYEDFTFYSLHDENLWRMPGDKTLYEMMKDIDDFDDLFYDVMGYGLEDSKEEGDNIEQDFNDNAGFENVIGYLMKHEYSLDDKLTIPINYGFIPLFHTLTSIGHSQGDYKTVIVPFPYSVAGEEVPEWLQKTIDNLLWDCPVYCRLEIDGVEYCFDHDMKDYYIYDKEEILAIANEQIDHPEKAYILEWLSDNLPDSPDYH